MKQEMTASELLEFAIDSFGASVFRAAYHQVRSHQSAEDITQEAFTELFQTPTKFQSDQHVKAWLLRVTLNKCKNFRRDVAIRSKYVSECWDPAAEVFMAASDTSFECDLNPTVWDVVDRLSDDFKAVIYLHYQEGYSIEEIAAITDTAPATVKTRLFRARQKIKALYQEVPDERLH